MKEETRKELHDLHDKLGNTQAYPNHDSYKSRVADILVSDLTESLSRNADSADRLAKVLIALEIIAVTIAGFALYFQLAKP